MVALKSCPTSSCLVDVSGSNQCWPVELRCDSERGRYLDLDGGRNVDYSRADDTLVDKPLSVHNSIVIFDLFMSATHTCLVHSGITGIPSVLPMRGTRTSTTSLAAVLLWCSTESKSTTRSTTPRCSEASTPPSGPTLTRRAQLRSPLGALAAGTPEGRLALTMTLTSLDGRKMRPESIMAVGSWCTFPRKQRRFVEHAALS